MLIRDRIVELRRVKASELVPDPRNWRTHPKAQQEALRGVLAEVGYADALLARVAADGRLVLVDGHLRAETTPDMEVPVLILDVTEAEAGKILLTLDPLAAMAEADTQALKALIDNVETESAAVQKMLESLATDSGIEPEELDADADPRIDEAEALRVKWGVERGQVWRLGAHRLMCGDSTSAEDVGRLMDGEVADACVSDPPYGMSWSADASRFSGGKFGNHPRGREREDVIGDDEPFDPSPYLGFKTVVLWGMNHFCGRLPAGGVLVWIKKPDERFGTFLSDCEIAWTNTGHGVYAIRHDWGGITRESERGEFLHPTQKPVAVVAWTIEQAKAGALLYDPFSGSGTTIIAAERLNRRCFAMEISPAYSAVAIQRWVDATGGVPERADG